MLIMKDDLGFYGKGLSGYVHYKQSVDRIGNDASQKESFLGSMNSRITKRDSEYIQRKLKEDAELTDKDRERLKKKEMTLTAFLVMIAIISFVVFIVLIISAAISGL